MRKLFFILFSFFFTVVSFGQINISVRAGGNIATTKSLIAFPKNRLGWYSGLIFKIPIQKKLFIQPELLFSSKGYKYVDLSDGKAVAMRLSYLNIPILLGYKIDGKTKILGGAEVGYLIRAINGFNDTNTEATTSSFPKKYDFGIAIGLQYDIIQLLGFEVRYIYGIKGFYQTDAVGIRRSESLAANRVFQIGLNYHLFK